MILKGNTRAGGQNLAAHLMNTRDNDNVELAEVRGFVADDLAGAFTEAEAIASATKCEKYLYSLSINPSEPMTRDQYGKAIEEVENRLGLTDQPRAVVFHVKDGREHCHIAWNRIDGETLKAKHIAFDRQKLREVSRDLGHEFGHKIPVGIANDRGTDRHADRFNDVSFAEKAQAERTGLSSEERRKVVTEAYHQSDSATAFRAALQEQGLILALGDKTDSKGRATPVLVDKAGEVHSLNRQIEGARMKDIRETLQLDKIPDLPTVQQAREIHATDLRQKAARPIEDGFNAVQKVTEAEQRLSTLTDAQRAELKAVKSGYSEQLDGFRKSEAAQIDTAKSAIKEAYRPEWRDLFRKQKEEEEAIKARIATPFGRVSALLRGQAGDAFDFENRNTLAGAFKFLVKGEADLSKTEKRHEAERRNLGDMQRLALKEETRTIKADHRATRKTARTNHQKETKDLTRDHKDERTSAERDLDRARGAAEKSGVSGGTARRKSLGDFMRSSYDAATLEGAQKSAREDAEREKTEQKMRGDDTGRGLRQ